jgi:hypothetical protein
LTVDNVVAALDEAFDRQKNVTLVFAFAHHMLPTMAGHRIRRTVNVRSGVIVCYLPTLVIQTIHDKIITAHFIGGMGAFFVPGPDSSSEESDDEVIEVVEVREPQLKRSNNMSTPPTSNRARAPVAHNYRRNISANLNSKGKVNHPVKNHNEDSDSSFEDTIGLTQELH